MHREFPTCFKLCYFKSEVSLRVPGRMFDTPLVAPQISRRAGSQTAAWHKGNTVNEGLPAGQQGVPGTERVWVKTFGCSHNFSDGEYMAGQLQAYGYRCGHPCAKPWTRF